MSSPIAGPVFCGPIAGSLGGGLMTLRVSAWLLTNQGLGGRHWTRTSDLLHVKQVL